MGDTPRTLAEVKIEKRAIRKPICPADVGDESKWVIVGYDYFVDDKPVTKEEYRAAKVKRADG